MFINYQKLDNAGYHINPTKKGLFIEVKEPMSLPFDDIRTLLHDAGVSPMDSDSGLDAMVIEIELQQIMRVIR